MHFLFLPVCTVKNSLEIVKYYCLKSKLKITNFFFFIVMFWGFPHLGEHKFERAGCFISNL